MPEQLVVRRTDDPATPLAREAALPAAAEHAAREARRSPGTIVEVVALETGRVYLRVRVGSDGRALAQRPTISAGDAWPDPPAWLPLERTA